MGDRLLLGLLALSLGDHARRLGNPLRTEAAAFRWLLVIIAAAVVAFVLVAALRAIL